LNLPVAPPDDGFPEAYAPFLPVLERLSEPLQKVLHGQLAQFERAFRTVDRHEMAQQGEFEGLGGLTMRGDISHILQSELLMRSHAPLEFLRRLVESETIYLDKQFADPGIRSVYRAMISMGPGVLGHGRLICLATIFFMARVARQRGATFHWCFMPRADGPVWFDEISVNTIKRFLRAASYKEMSPDDVAAARRAWGQVETDPLRPDKIDHVDWTIGAAARRPAVRSDHRIAAAFDDADNILSFALLSPRPDEPRSAQLLLRQGGREQQKVEVTFPDDRICLSALSDPFRPLKPTSPALPAGKARAVQTGWETEYLSIPRTQLKIVRLTDGVLILLSAAKRGFAQKWFIPLPKSVILVGIKVDELLSIIVHSDRDGWETLTYGQFRLSARQTPLPVLQHRKQATSRQLFRNRSRYAIPPLNLDGSVEFYSASGDAFELTFDHLDRAVHFSPLRKTPKTLLAVGAYRIVKIVENDTTILRMLKNRAKHVDDYVVPPLVPDHIREIFLSGSERSLAYSVAPGQWRFPPKMTDGVAGETAEIQLEAHETLLTGNNNGTHVTARIWSDARYGGNGTIRSVRYGEREEAGKQPLLKLGDDALSIVKVQVADDGVWALSADADGEPCALLHYKRRSSGQYECTRFEIEELLADAVRIDLATLDA